MKAETQPSSTPRMIWRWHFYAGLFCIPFVVWLSITGSIYLFKPQFERWQDHSYTDIAAGLAPASAAAQVDAALAAVAGSTFKAYELAPTPASAARVIVNRGTEELRVYVHPQTLQILEVQNSEQRLMAVVHELHGNLLLGDRGSLLIELAASWAIVMVLSGLYLWWPRNARLAGVVYPRLHLGGRQFWRDLHAVIGLWVSAFALFLLITALPWTNFWGSNFKALRQLGSKTVVQQDWSIGGAEPATAEEDQHAGHHAHDSSASSMQISASRYAALDRLIATVSPLHLAAPVQILPPSQASPNWTARSLTQNRPQRVTLTLDGDTGAVLKRRNFSDGKLLDRIVGYGIAAHEGHLFGWFNQLLGLFTALGLITLGVSGYLMWWKRRPAGTLGAPRPLADSHVSPALWGLTALLGALLPLLGLSIVTVVLVERLLLRRIPAVASFLGLQTTTRQRHAS